jgi:hypothetical protein
VVRARDRPDDDGVGGDRDRLTVLVAPAAGEQFAEVGRLEPRQQVVTPGDDDVLDLAVCAHPLHVSHGPAGKPQRRKTRSTDAGTVGIHTLFAFATRPLEPPVAEQSRLDKVIALARHRGFVFQAGEIYGGSRSAWDYGPSARS